MVGIATFDALTTGYGAVDWEVPALQTLNGRSERATNLLPDGSVR